MNKDKITFLNDPDRAKAFWRLFLNPLTPWAVNCSDEMLNMLFAPPGNTKEAILLHTVDLLAFMVFNEETSFKMISDIISKALPEIEEFYNVILRKGGGWSSRKGGPEQRQAAALEWFDQQEARLSYLKKSYIEDPRIYNDAGGQEKRNFIIGLLMRVLQQKIDNEKITFQKVHEQFKRFKEHGDWLRQLLALTK